LLKRKKLQFCKLVLYKLFETNIVYL